MSSQRSAVAGTIPRSPRGDGLPGASRSRLAARPPASRAGRAARSRGSPRRPAPGIAPASRRGSRAGSRRRPCRCRGSRPVAGARPPRRARPSARTRSAALDHVPRVVSTVRPSCVRIVATIVRSGPVEPDDRRSASSSGRHQPRPDRHPEVLALRGPEAERALVALQVARGPVVEDEVAADRLLAALVGEVDRRRVDQRPDLQLVVQLRRSLAGPRPGRPVRAARTRSRSRRSAAGTRAQGSPPRAAPTSCARGARTRRSRGTRAGGGSAGRRRGRRRRGRRRRRRSPRGTNPSTRSARAATAGRGRGGRRASSPAADGASCRGRGSSPPRWPAGGRPRGRPSACRRNRAPPPGASRLLRRRVVPGRGRDASPESSEGCGGPGSSRQVGRQARRGAGGYLIILPSASTTYHLPPRPWPLVSPAAVSPAK